MNTQKEAIPGIPVATHPWSPRGNSILFNAFYHRYPILSEAEEARKKFLLATVAVVRRELIRVLAAMGITVPPVM